MDESKFYTYGEPPTKISKTINKTLVQRTYSYEYENPGDQARPNMVQFDNEPLPFMSIMRKAREGITPAEEKKGVRVVVKDYGTFEFGWDGWKFEKE